MTVTNLPRKVNLHTVIDTLVDAAAKTGTTLPAQLDLEAAQQAQFAGDPATELAKRAKVCGREPAKHRDAFARLATQLTPNEVWFTLNHSDLTESEFSTALHQLMKVGVLPVGNSLCQALRTYGTHERVMHALTTAEYLRDRADGAVEPMSTATLVEFAEYLGLDRTHPAGVLELAAGAQWHGYSDTDLGHLVRLAGAALALDPAWGRRSYHSLNLPRITAEQTEQLVAAADPAALVVALKYGRMTQELKVAAAANPGCLRLVTGNEGDSLNRFRPGDNDLAHAITRAIHDRPEELTGLSSQVAQWVLRYQDVQHVPMPVLLDLLTQAESQTEWLTKRYGNNVATAAQVTAAINAGAITALHVLNAAARGAHDRDFFAALVTTTPGVGAAFVEAAGSRNDWEQTVVQHLLPHVATLFGGDAALWERLLASASSPGGLFLDRSLAEAARILLDRWAQAATRAS